MNIRFAHLNEQGIDFAVFAADAIAKTPTARQRLLCDLTSRARRGGLRVDKSALQYEEGNGIYFFGTPDLVHFLQSVGGVFNWTHQLRV